MYPCILVALDGSQASLEGLREAIRLAQGHPTRLILLHLIDDFPTLREIASNRSMAQLEAERRDSAQTLLEQGVQLAHASQVEAGLYLVPRVIE